MLHLAGRPFVPAFSIVRHRGRASGKTYLTPVIVEPVDGGFMFALTWGPRTDWVLNLRAAQGGELRRHGVLYRLSAPRFVSAAEGAAAFPRLARVVLQRVGVRDFLRVTATRS